MKLTDIEQALRRGGLTPRGAFHPRAEDGVPDLAPGRPAATVVMAGNAGPAMWQAFSAQRDPHADLLDDWSLEVLSALAAELGGAALFPFTRPHLPFQRWAARAEPCHPSPLGIYVHPDYGLWHGFRGALAFAERLELPPPDLRPSPCETCADKPCLEACPAGAFSTNGHAVPRCVAHIRIAAGADCMDHGCRARRACPVGREYRQAPAQAGFHMRAFLRARLAESA
jgi:hypothetical protein